jgi:Trypsin
MTKTLTLQIKVSAISLMLISFAVPLATAQSSQGTAGKTVIMVPIKQMGEGLPQIDGGTQQEPVNWPATLKYYLTEEFACTSTIVGSRTVITAAHCINDVPTEVKIDNISYKLVCDRHPHFERDALISDVALCFSDKQFPNTFAYENIDLRITHVRPNSKLFLLGFGCRNVLTLGQTGQLYGGTATVFMLSNASGAHIQTKDGVVICPGDSGGAAYLLSDLMAVAGPRSVVGINSGYMSQIRVSFLTGFTGLIADFIRDWSADRGVTICGIHVAATNCRDRYSP